MSAKHVYLIDRKVAVTIPHPFGGKTVYRGKLTDWEHDYIILVTQGGRRVAVSTNQPHTVEEI